MGNSSLTCLLIDDDIDEHEIFKLAIESTSFPVDCITSLNGFEALAHLKNGLSPDFIFLDINMPKMNGWQCLEAIRNLPVLMQVPVIIYSTSHFRTNTENTVQKGATLFLQKPSSVQELAEALKKIFST